MHSRRADFGLVKFRVSLAHRLEGLENRTLLDNIGWSRQRQNRPGGQGGSSTNLMWHAYSADEPSALTGESHG
jgi:hypothetical protein